MVEADACYQPRLKQQQPQRLIPLRAFTVGLCLEDAQQLRTANRNVVNAYMAMKNASGLLNGVLFKCNGVYENAQWVKAYLRSVFGKGSQQHKDVSQLEFVKR